MQWNTLELDTETIFRIDKIWFDDTGANTYKSFTLYDEQGYLINKEYIDQSTHDITAKASYNNFEFTLEKPFYMKAGYTLYIEQTFVGAANCSYNLIGVLLDDI